MLWFWQRPGQKLQDGHSKQLGGIVHLLPPRPQLTGCSDSTPGFGCACVVSSSDTSLWSRTCSGWLDMQFGRRRTRHTWCQTPALNLFSRAPRFHQCLLVICPRGKLKVLCGSFLLSPMGVFRLWYVAPGADPSRNVGGWGVLIPVSPLWKLHRQDKLSFDLCVRGRRGTAPKSCYRKRPPCGALAFSSQTTGQPGSPELPPSVSPCHPPADSLQVLLPLQPFMLPLLELARAPTNVLATLSLPTEGRWSSGAE